MKCNLGVLYCLETFQQLGVTGGVNFSSRFGVIGVIRLFMVVGVNSYRPSNVYCVVLADLLYRMFRSVSRLVGLMYYYDFRCNENLVKNLVTFNLGFLVCSLWEITLQL